MHWLPWSRVALALLLVGGETAVLLAPPARPTVVAAPGGGAAARPASTDPFYVLLTADDVARGAWGLVEAGHDLRPLAPRVAEARARREAVDAARVRRRAAHEATVRAWARVAESLGPERTAALARAAAPPPPPGSHPLRGPP